MADGCLSNVVKYALFLTNFLIFVSIFSNRTMIIMIIMTFPQLLGVAVLGCGIWVLVDKPSFLDLFEQVVMTKTKTNTKTKTKTNLASSASLSRSIYFQSRSITLLTVVILFEVNIKINFWKCCT